MIPPTKEEIKKMKLVPKRWPNCSKCKKEGAVHTPVGWLCENHYREYEKEKRRKKN